jgi:phage shock protein PspC (stress-responsive transcriptional regulator)
MNDIHSSFAQQGLVRPRDERVLGGVASGLGRRFGFAPWPARILFVLLLMVIPGSQILIYPILWILMPSEQAVGAPTTPPSAAPSNQTPPTYPGQTPTVA